jgi:hypothetical protein
MAAALANALATLEPLKRRFADGMGVILHHDALAIVNGFATALSTLAAGDTPDTEPGPVEDPNVGPLAPIPVNIAPPGEPVQTEPLPSEAPNTPPTDEPAPSLSPSGPEPVSESAPADPGEPLNPSAGAEPSLATPGLFDP